MDPTRQTTTGTNCFLAKRKSPGHPGLFLWLFYWVVGKELFYGDWRLVRCAGRIEIICGDYAETLRRR
jgi:hypothetical protein